MTDYLWDKSGPVDDEVAALEGLLGEYRLKDAAPIAEVVELRPRAMPRGGILALAACALMLVSALVWSLAKEARFNVIGVDGVLHISAGERITTTETAFVELPVGTLELAKGSELSLDEARGDRLAFTLARGRMEASVDAPPRFLVVDTPAGRATDLGCVYTLKALGARTELAVTNGWVELAGDGQRALVVEGSAAMIEKGRAPSVPVRADARDAFKVALESLDDDGALANAVGRVDDVSLWHLIERTKEGPRIARALLRRHPYAHPELVIEGDKDALYDWVLNFD